MIRSFFLSPPSPSPERPEGAEELGSMGSFFFFSSRLCTRCDHLGGTPTRGAVFLSFSFSSSSCHHRQEYAESLPFLLVALRGTFWLTRLPFSFMFQKCFDKRDLVGPSVTLRLPPVSFVSFAYRRLFPPLRLFCEQQVEAAFRAFRLFESLEISIDIGSPFLLLPPIPSLSRNNLFLEA